MEKNYYHKYQQKIVYVIKAKASIDETAHYRATNANFHLRDIWAEHVEYGAPSASKLQGRIPH